MSHTVYSKLLRCPHTVYSKLLRCPHTVYSKLLRCTHTVYSKLLRCTHTVYSKLLRCTHTVYSKLLRCIHTVYWDVPTQAQPLLDSLLELRQYQKKPTRDVTLAVLPPELTDLVTRQALSSSPPLPSHFPPSLPAFIFLFVCQFPLSVP